MNIVKTPESEALIRFPDCDPFNHLNNSRYIDYFINAREDHLMKFYNFNTYQVAAEKGVSWVVTQHRIAYLRPALLMEKRKGDQRKAREKRIAYLRPALLMEKVIIQSSLLKFGEKDVMVEMQMWDKNKKHLKSLIWTTFVHYNLKTHKSEIHADEFKEKFKQLENPFEKEISFEERIKNLNKAD